ncbi:MAG: cytidine/deoxycytidine deaminase [Acidimicrobiales bacterium]|nr:cytidine/deoxycytidine deaminase [Acidimicrobiales bacterium]
MVAIMQATSDDGAEVPLDAVTAAAWLLTATEQARIGMAEGGIPIGAALYSRAGELLGTGHNRRVQDGDPSMHAETAAFKAAGRRRSYRDTVMVTTLAPCWYCSGLVRQFGIGGLVIGESVNFSGGQEWLRAEGVEVVDLADATCIELLGTFIAGAPTLWNEDIGVD